MQKLIQSSTLELIKASWDATKEERGRLILFIVLFTVSYLFELAVPVAIGYTLGIFVSKGFTDEAYHQSLKWLGAYILLGMGNSFFHHYARFVQNRVTYSARMFTLNQVFGSFMVYPLNWHVRRHSGENLSKLHRSAGAIESTIGTYLWQVVEGFVKVTFASIAIFALDFWVAVNVIVTGLLTIFGMIYFNKKVTAMIRTNNAFNNKISRICIDYLFNIVTVKTLGLEKQARQYLSRQKDEGLLYSQRISKFMELKWGTTSMGYRLVVGSSLLIYFYGHKDLSRPFEVAQVYVLLDYLNKIFAAIGSFTAYYGGIIEASTAYEDASEIVVGAEEVVEQERGSVKIDPSWHTLLIRNVSFSYFENERAGLTELSVDIEKGDKVALVGPSGGGKSTFLKILGGLLSPQVSSLSTDVQRDIPITSIAQLSLLVPQEPEIFSESLLYNLTMGDEFPRDDIEQYTLLCKLEGVIEKLPQKWSTDLAEKGLNLSVGEKQRVAMARGLLRLKTKQIMLLDEPTSSLDPKTEKDIFLGILERFKDRTIVTACHRLNLVPLFNKIIYIRNGRVEEVGGFDELLGRQGLFAKAWEDYQKKLARE